MYCVLFLPGIFRGGAFSVVSLRRYYFRSIITGPNAHILCVSVCGRERVNNELFFALSIFFCMRFAFVRILRKELRKIRNIIKLSTNEN